MRSFQRPDTLDPVPGATVAVLRSIDLAAGSEARFADQVPQLLVEDRRVDTLLSGEAQRFRDRNEAEFAGYRAALDYLNQTDPGDFSVGLILHLHRLLFSYTAGRGGHFKTDDNVVVDRHSDGTTGVRFEPVSAQETPFFVDELVARTSEGLASGDRHPLLVIAACVLDLSCIHPFADGNGRVARLVTTHLLHHAGYRVGRYVSIEQLIFETKDGYYAALGASTDRWFDDGHHALWPWADYLLDRIDLAYQRFSTRVAAGLNGDTKQGRIRDFVLMHAPPKFTIADIRRAVPGVSDQTIRLVLTELKLQHRITNDGTGRSAAWYRT
jgi:Fic family protein